MKPEKAEREAAQVVRAGGYWFARPDATMAEVRAATGTLGSASEAPDDRLSTGFHR